MDRTRVNLLDRLMHTAAGVPDDKLREVVDFADFLEQRQNDREPARGSAEAILQALDRVGPLEFEPGELDELLDEIERMRMLDIATSISSIESR